MRTRSPSRPAPWCPPGMTTPFPWRVARALAFGSRLNTLNVLAFGLALLLAGGARPAPEEGAAARAVAVSPDGARVAGAGQDGSIRLWNGADGKEVRRLAGHHGAVQALALSPNGQLLVSAGHDRTLRFWNAARGEPVAAFAA